MKPYLPLLCWFVGVIGCAAPAVPEEEGETTSSLTRATAPFEPFALLLTETTTSGRTTADVPREIRAGSVTRLRGAELRVGAIVARESAANVTGCAQALTTTGMTTEEIDEESEKLRALCAKPTARLATLPDWSQQASLDRRRVVLTFTAAAVPSDLRLLFTFELNGRSYEYTFDSRD